MIDKYEKKLYISFIEKLNSILAKRHKNIKCCVCVCLLFLLTINNFAVNVNENDENAFITRNEFETMSKNLKEELYRFSSNIDSNIDVSIASYMAGIVLKAAYELNLLIDYDGKYGGNVVKWNSSTTGRRDTANKKYYTVTIDHKAWHWYPGSTDGIANLICNTKIEASSTAYFPKSRGLKASSKYDTWLKEKDADGGYVTPGILTPKILQWVTWVETKDIRHEDWHTNITQSFRPLKRNATNWGNVNSAKWWSLNVYRDKSEWETNITHYTVYPESTSAEYCFYDYEEYVESVNCASDDSGSNWRLENSDYCIWTCAFGHNKDSTIVPTYYVTKADWYNPTFAKNAGNSQNLKIKPWHDVSSNNNMVKNGLYIGSLPEKPQKIEFKAKAEVPGKLYMYFGDTAIDMVNNKTNCASFDITTTENKYSITSENAKKDNKIWIIFLPTSTTTEGYVGIKEMVLTKEIY